VINGTATFNDLTMSDEGTAFQLTFSATTAVGITPAVSDSFDVTNNSTFIYFSSNRTGSFEVWKMKDDGTQQTQVTSRAMVSDPTPAKNSVNGRVAFSDGPFGIQALYTMDGVGGNIRLVQTHSDAGEVSWSPNGLTLASRVAAGAPSFGLFTINGDGTNRQQLSGGVADYPSWSQDGANIAFTKNYLDLVTSSSSGGGDTPILRHDTTSTGAGVLRTALGDSVLGFINSAAALVPFDYLNTFILHTAWSPDGMRIAFELQDRNGVAHIFAISNLGGGVLVPLTKLATLSDRSPTWSPDGTKIYFQSNRSGTWQIWSMNADGSGAVQLTSAGQNYSPSWWN
jgi:Tol biopolymer transport system component